MSSPLIENTQKKQKLLIITSSGGGGLIQAAKAKQQEALAKNPSLIIVWKDLLKDWMGTVFGKFCQNRWNHAQITGNVNALRFFIASQYLFDYICWPWIFFRALVTFFIEDIDCIIDTQPIGTSPILKALRIYNYFKKKHVVLQKVLVDLPTKDATHFFRPIKHLRKKDHPYFRLVTISPLLEEGQTEEDFWKKNCRLTLQEIQYENVYVRQSFKKYQGRSKAVADVSLFTRYKNEEELFLIQKTCKKGSLQSYMQTRTELHFTIPPKSRLVTLLLGSQPASDATLKYVTRFIEVAQQYSYLDMLFHLFVFCAEHTPEKNTLFRKIADMVEHTERYPKILTIIPFSFQEDDVLATLFYRSNLTCTRSGGQTAMELLCVSPPEIWVHSEAKLLSGKKEKLSAHELLKGIPGWEAANALYLQKFRNAHIVTPDSCLEFAHRFFQSNESVDQPIPSFAKMA